MPTGGPARAKALRLAAFIHLRKQRVSKVAAGDLIQVTRASGDRYEAWFTANWDRKAPCPCRDASPCRCCPESTGCTVFDLSLYSSDRILIQENGCWHWTTNINSNKGYGFATPPGRGRKQAHRYVYEELRGAIPEGLTLDHQCHNRDETCAGGVGCLHRRCVNPSHLEPATAWENTSRGNSPSALNLDKATCPEGHPYTHLDDRGWRKCRTCEVLAKREKRGASGRPVPASCRKGHQYDSRVLRWPNGWRFCPTCHPNSAQSVWCETCMRLTPAEHVCLALQANALAAQAARRAEFEHASPSDLYTP